jgi:hypothetical protein
LAAGKESSIATLTTHTATCRNAVSESKLDETRLFIDAATNLVLGATSLKPTVPKRRRERVKRPRRHSIES